MKEEFVPRKRKMYLSSWKERGEVCEFINKQLRKEYIRSLKLSQIALVFCVETKNSRKCMVQDYRYLNTWTVKTKNSLSLISDIVKNIGTKKVFTKLDLYWGYNNVWVKKRDKCNSLVW